MDLDESQIGVVLKQGLTVERRLIIGGWESVTEAPIVFPVDSMAARPAVPHSSGSSPVHGRRRVPLETLQPEGPSWLLSFPHR